MPASTPAESLQTFTVFVLEQGHQRVVGFSAKDHLADPREPQPGPQSRIPASRAAFLHVPAVSRITTLQLNGHAVVGLDDDAANAELVRGIGWASDRLTAGAFHIHYSADAEQVIPMRLMATPQAWTGDLEGERARQADRELLKKQMSELPLLMPGHLYPLHIGVLQDLDFGFGPFKHIPGVLCYWSLVVGTTRDRWVYANDYDYSETFPRAADGAPNKETAT